jgi:spore maturation protein SpmB
MCLILDFCGAKKGIQIFIVYIENISANKIIIVIWYICGWIDILPTHTGFFFYRLCDNPHRKEQVSQVVHVLC